MRLVVQKICGAQSSEPKPVQHEMHVKVPEVYKSEIRLTK